MRYAVSLFDAIFGRKVVVEIPNPAGGVRKITVTAKWVEKMEREGKLSPADKRYVQVHILDPEAAMTELLEGREGSDESDHRVEHWVIGENISVAQYEKFVDPKTKGLYAVTRYADGKRTISLVQRDLWFTVRGVEDRGE